MTAPAPSQRDARVVAAYQAQTAQMRAKVTAYITAAWAALGYYGSPDVARFVAQVVPVVGAAQSQMSALTVGYLAAQRNAVVGRSRSVRVNPVSVSGAAARNGVAPADVYARPFHEVWRQLGAAKTGLDVAMPRDSIDKAIQSGLNNAVSSAVTDMQLAKVQTAQQITAHDPDVVGYRRVLEGAYSCGLCIVASTRSYHKAALLPIHPACDCSIQPIYEGEDFTAEHLGTLSAVHQSIADRFGKSSAAARDIPGQIIDGKPVQYRDILITHQHGELGPVLGVRGQHFASAHDYDIPDVVPYDLNV